MKNPLNMPMFSTDLVLLNVDLTQPLFLPFFDTRLSAGFPSPAEDYSISSIDIGEFVTSNPLSTFFVRVQGDSMIDAHITDGCLLAVDKSLIAKSGDIIVAVVNNEFTVKRLSVKAKKVFLVPENKKYQPIEITEEMNFQVWGKVVTIMNKP
ncbi:LexA family protein [Adhaeribacter terreus]|uniref:LexA family protein n=1 Tax=Adhaeribacter terreus TaxID=529703 RepID=A0ABW0EER5_9BACT